MNTLEFKSNCPECGNICLRDFWVSEAETQTMDIYDINGSTFTSRSKSTYDQVEINGSVFKVQSVRENSMFGNTTYVYNLPAPVPAATSAKFTQPVGKALTNFLTMFQTSFEITQDVLDGFIKDLEILEKACRAY